MLSYWHPAGKRTKFDSELYVIKIILLKLM